MLWGIIADVLRESAKAAEVREVEECMELMAGEIEWDKEPSKEETVRLQKEETFLVKMLKELEGRKPKRKVSAPTRRGSRKNQIRG